MSFPHDEATGLGTPPPTLPFARRPDVGGPTVLESLKIPIEAEVFTRLLSVASDLDLVLLAVWQTLLWRFTDQSEVVVGWLSQDRTQDQSRAAMAMTFSEDLTLFDIVQHLHKSKPRAAEPHTQDKCVHELFEDQVKLTPQHTALRFHEQTYTFHALNVRANQLAHFLRKRSVGPNVPVALFVERSAEMIIGLLGIIKAGGCYVPLVHDDPQARLAYLLAETQPPVLLTSRKLLSRLPEYSGEIVLLDESFDLEPGTDPENKAKSSDLVCVIYTSGSTGVPKGVAARHSNLANYIHFICER